MKTPFFGPMPEPEYREIQTRDQWIGGSTISKVGDLSPAHAEIPFAGSPAATFGTFAHCGVLEPEHLAARYAVEAEVHKVEVEYVKTDAGWRANGAGPYKTKGEATKAAGPWRRVGSDLCYRTRAEAKGDDTAGDRIAMSGADHERMHAMADAISRHDRAAELLSGGAAELALFWTDDATGIQCSGRIDYYKPGIIVDYKTTNRPVPPHAAARWIVDRGIHVQTAHYAAGVEAAGVIVTAVYIVVQEAIPPYAVGVYEFDLTMRALGVYRRKCALEAYRDRRGQAYPVEVVVVEPPGYRLTPAFRAWREGEYLAVELRAEAALLRAQIDAAADLAGDIVRRDRDFDGAADMWAMVAGERARLAEIEAAL